MARITIPPIARRRSCESTGGLEPVPWKPSSMVCATLSLSDIERTAAAIRPDAPAPGSGARATGITRSRNERRTIGRSGGGGVGLPAVFSPPPPETASTTTTTTIRTAAASAATSARDG